MVQDHYTFTNSAGKYLVHATITAASTGKNVAVMILEFLDKYESRDTLKALASDGTVANTGRPVARIFAGGGVQRRALQAKHFFGLFLRWYMVFFITLSMHAIKTNLFNKCI